MPFELIYHQIKPYLKRITQMGAVVLTIFVIFALFSYFVAPDRTRMKQNAVRSEQNLIRSLHEILYTRKNDLGPDGAAIADFLTYGFCNVSGALCSDKLELTRREGLGTQIGDILALPLKNPPASGMQTVAQAFERAGFVPKAYAQGIGFASLTSFQTIWKSVRDVVLLGLVILIVVSGFMIMFNIPGSGKTSATVETMLPRLVITLLAITFSYAIAGFLVDMMYVMMFLVVAIFSPILPGNNALVISAFTSGSPVNLFEMMFSGANGQIFLASQALYAIIPSQIRYLIDYILFYALGTSVLTFIQQKGTAPGRTVRSGRLGWLDIMLGNAGSFLEGRSKATSPSKWSILFNPMFNPVLEKLSKVASNTDKGAEWIQGNFKNLSILGNNWTEMALGVFRLLFIDPFLRLLRSFLTVAIIFILVMFAFLLSIFKLFWMLFSTYVSIVLLIVFAPAQIALNALPGNNSFVNWLKQLAILLLTFPLVLVFFFVGLFFMQSPDLNEMWSPPFVSGLMPSQQAVQVLIGGTILFSIPKLIDKIRDLLGYKAGFSLSPVTMISPWIGLAGGTVSSLTGMAKLRDGIKTTGGLGGRLFGAKPSTPTT